MNAHAPHHLPRPHLDALYLLVLAAFGVLGLMCLIGAAASCTEIVHPDLNPPITTSPEPLPEITAPGMGAYILVPGDVPTTNPR